MKDMNLSLRGAVIMCGILTIVYLLIGERFSEVVAIGTLSYGDLLLAIVILAWLIVVIRWLYEYTNRG